MQESRLAPIPEAGDGNSRTGSRRKSEVKLGSGSWNRKKLGKENRGGSSGIGGKVSATRGGYGRLVGR